MVMDPMRRNQTLDAGPTLSDAYELIAGPQPPDLLLPNRESGASNPSRVGALAVLSD
jgi:hypothetical protein